MNDQKKLEGIGRKIILDNYIIFKEGQFVDNELTFGRMVTGAGYYAMGHWRDAWKLHGYAKRIQYGKVQEGLFEEALLSLKK